MAQRTIDAIREIDPMVLQMTNQQLRLHINTVRDQLDFTKRTLEQVRQDIRMQKATEAEAQKRIDASKQLPMLICSVAELFIHKDEETGEDLQSVVIKTTSRDTVYCPTPGLVAYNDLKPGETIAVNRDTYLIYERLPQFYDARVKQMLVAEKPKDTFKDVGGMELIIKQVEEAVLLPFNKPHLFEQIGIQPSKGLLLYGAPGVGKTLIARCIANACDCIFLSMCATQLIQMYIGDGSQMLQEIFQLAKEYVDKDTINGVPQNSPANKTRGAIIYIDEIDAIGTRRYDAEQNAGREVARTLMTLLNLMDGFISNSMIKVVASTNRVDSLDPALVRSNRFDRKIECPLPNLVGRQQILKIHSKMMKLDAELSLEEVAKSCENFSGAQLKAVCVEAGMHCMRRNGREVDSRDFVEGVAMVQNKKVSVEGGYV